MVNNAGTAPIALYRSVDGGDTWARLPNAVSPCHCERAGFDSRVLRITHDKGWINDDDPGATYPGWSRRCNLGTGDFNNDLTVSDKPGAT